MAIKNILVAYNGTPAADSALKLGLLMAKKYSAHLTGVFAQGVPEAFESAAPYLTQGLANQFREISLNAQKQARETVANRFREIVGSLDADNLHWLEVYGSGDSSIIEIARCFDVTVLGQLAADAEKRHSDLHPDVIALMSGKPVLIVPRGYETAALGDRAALAWDGKRACSRAMSDAMQILETKASVQVLSVGDVPACTTPSASITIHLDRHGIPSEEIRLKRQGSIAKTLLDHCDKAGVDLLVMGAYEHSKFSEDFIGGVTNDVLRSAKIPVFMSH